MYLTPWPWLGSCSLTPSAATNTHFSLTVEASGSLLPVSKCTGSPEKLSYSGNTQTVARRSLLFFQPPPYRCVFLRLVPKVRPRNDHHYHHHHLHYVAADEWPLLAGWGWKALSFVESELQWSFRCLWHYCLWITRIMLTKTSAALAPQRHTSHKKMSPWLCSTDMKTIMECLLPHVFNCIQWWLDSSFIIYIKF